MTDTPIASAQGGQTTQDKLSDLMRPIIGVENRSAQEVFYIMCDRITSALRSATPTPRVKVLEWFPVEAICTREKAQALGGHYSVVEFDKDRPDRHFATNIDLGGLAFVFLLEPDMEFGGTRPKRFSTTEAAKAAAQADYEARILSALTAPPAREISEAEVERAAIPPAPKPVEDMLSILAEIVAISDRDHVAWRRAKALIEMSRVTNHSHQIARGDR
jgi:hypothetical protein